jgi:hypothetical protein
MSFQKQKQWSISYVGSIWRAENLISDVERFRFVCRKPQLVFVKQQNNERAMRFC